ncbi:hypothetical protein BG015_004502 [Linnemannia schmuckeri]|uniref:Uncharacterized protein n=1 Tax=Linnemannia schmuckeri TaxID=64567 RepID=A0A9P5UZS1_9FUNG|nr:hypothetical protein BG015_004502 [Linnemannia schmuckeri]
MSKRFLDNKSMEQEYEERRQFIRQNAPSMELKTLTKRFFAKFDLQSSSIDKENQGTEPGDASVFMPTSIPSENAQKEFPVWSVDDIDMVQKFHDFRAGNQGPFSLARDGIADLMYDSSFCQTLDPTVLSIVRRAEPAPNIYERWPTLGPICDRVFVSNSYDEVACAVRSESMRDPIAAYLFVIIMAYSYHSRRTEAALIHYPTLEKRRQDEFKLARAMRDSWISHVRSVSSLAVPPRGLAVFGSVSFKDETKLLRMDFQGAFRLQQFDLFVIPLNKSDFGNKMRAAVISCLELAARLHQEVERRRQPSITLGYYDRVALADASRLIEKTTSTPTKIPKTPKKK